jgi:hypothetical protein
MASDCHFAQGKTHDVCQDYAMALRNAIVVSDGCSSSFNTDWGSRFLARAAMMEVLDQEWAYGDRILSQAAQMLLGTGLGTSALDATLLVAWKADDLVLVRVWGDGIVSARRRDTGLWEHHVIEYDQNFPAYLSYMLDGARMDKFMEHTSGKRKTSLYAPTEDGEYGLPDLSYAEGFPYEGIAFEFDEAVYDMVALCSDGVQSFQQPEGSPTSKRFMPVPLTEVLGLLLDVRGTAGEFIKRPMKWLLNKHCAKWRWHHYDDVAVAALYLGDLDE